ncbi:MAG: hypothetical protein COU22_03720 [Candidatus Komeilibacteria bacterium CG10_big_fil_rev_8_21_14_0_10_41_13]|uniref:Uncharacterized protein n=1 Tax=Candidatus Komeilibacteria bacterium CG10_big_fil_rev_8_21_14_0_10_41_13 TaxID=1974476 RepID=A0A2M6WBJ9_9BACT|nr:MAG: hypothetical protein COU22_03720 [Candidatus Komeilibacteria bacterium CG10_big_fil_rev_8_21_14_0_10_41_13]
MSEEKNQLPPEWQTTIDMLNGKFNNELYDLTLDSWEVICVLAVKTRFSHVPDQHKEAVADAFIEAVKLVFDQEIMVAVASLFKSWNMGDKVLAALNAAQNNDNCDALSAIAEEMGLELSEIGEG